jgi:YidC/Oxa1 family membrane protein insertase
MVKLSGKDSVVIPFVLQVDADSRIIKNITFYGKGYSFREEIILENMEEYIPSRGYKLVWDTGLRPQEKNSVDEANSSFAHVSMNEDLDKLDATDEGEQGSYTGLIDFAAVTSKYFTTAIIPSPYKSFDGTVDLSGKKRYFPNDGQSKVYSVEFRLPYSGGIETKSFEIYCGPLDYKIAKEYKLQGLVDLGWKYGIRQIGEYFMLPIFNLIHSLIHNYGISLILFALLMKLLLYPLSIGQMRSAQRMKLVNPIVNKVREDYKDDMTRQQQEVMKVYSQYGINPAGGCLPLLLQMPILYALWSVLRSAIDLRQAHFIWWIKDLSVPDTIIYFGTSIMGISSLSGLALLMGATLFIQQKQTITDPRQKAMVYIMPVMLTLLFNSLPSGLNLYYFTFNIVSILMQLYINKYSRYQPTLEQLKKAPKKEGWMQRKMREAQEIAAKQGRTLPGQPKSQPVQGQKRVQQGKPKKK